MPYTPDTGRIKIQASYLGTCVRNSFGDRRRTVDKPFTPAGITFRCYLIRGSRPVNATERVSVYNPPGTAPQRMRNISRNIIQQRANYTLDMVLVSSSVFAAATRYGFGSVAPPDIPEAYLFLAHGPCG
ncbi:hypothetical protein M8818_001656 [Zalaria obscura]|uniref:Uncharacterized protein n=1 Tax=Zalaria obscura TaxID=2024903 RepID=A0ACC3SK31_9PEZI